MNEPHIPAGFILFIIIMLFRILAAKQREVVAAANPVVLDNESARLQRERLVYLDGEITDETAGTVIASILYLQAASPYEPLTLVIDSPGGSVSASLAIIDAIEELTVLTYCNGYAGGMAALVLAAGKRGERVMVRESWAALTTINPGPDTPPDVVATEVVRVRLMLTNLLAKYSGRDATTVASDMILEREFNAAEAVLYGLADRVTER